MGKTNEVLKQFIPKKNRNTFNLMNTQIKIFSQKAQPEKLYPILWNKDSKQLYLSRHLKCTYFNMKELPCHL